MIIENDNTNIEHRCSHLILATGHSARDIYELLDKKKIVIEAKPFCFRSSLSILKEFIDKIQYSCHSHDELFLNDLILRHRLIA